MNRRRLSLLCVAAAALLTVSACGSSGSGSASASSGPVKVDGSTGQTGPFQGSQFIPAQPRPSFTLTDTTGKPFSFGTVTAGHPTLLYFGYTHCPDVCPTTMADVSQALASVPADVAKKTYVVFVSTDVVRDTGPVIAQWLSNFSGGSKATWVGLHGTEDQIVAAQAAAHVTVAQDMGETHSAEVLLYGPDDYAHVFFLQSNNEEKVIAHDLPLVARGVTG